jgi:hypothetical protein
MLILFLVSIPVAIAFFSILRISSWLTTPFHVHHTRPCLPLHLCEFRFQVPRRMLSPAHSLLLVDRYIPECGRMF